jgi:hypothetical protein
MANNGWQTIATSKTATPTNTKNTKPEQTNISPETRSSKGSAMTSTAKTTPSKARQIASISAILLLTGTTLSACSRTSEAQAAVQEAQRSFNDVAAGDPTASEQFAEQTYKETEQLVAEHAGSDDGFAEAAAVSLSLAKLGQASLASSKASKIETQALLKARVIRGMINQWLTADAIAQAASLFDATDELNEINNLIALRQADVKQYKQQREEVEARIHTLEIKITVLQNRAAAERNESGALELQMPRVSATKAAQIVQRVREHTLKADNYELEAIRIEGVVGQLRPGAKEIGLNVDKATSQIELLQNALIEIDQRKQSSKADQTQSTNDAAKALASLKAAVNDYATFRDTQVQQASDQAIALTKSAIAALRDANKAVKQVATLTKASAQQSLAETYARQAIGHAEAQLLYQSLIEANIPGDWAAPEQKTRAQQLQARQDANDAYISAAASLRRAGTQGEAREKIEATAKRLEALAGLQPEPEYNPDQDNMDSEMDMDHDTDEMDNMDHSEMDMTTDEG